METKQTKTPNILLITADQLRYDYVGAYQEYPFIETPHIDALAQDGCLCENAYSPNPVCIPARHNLITGLSARHHGFDDNYFGPEAKPCPWNLPTFAQILSDVGYRTAAVGKMHFQPERRCTGFDTFINCDEVVQDVTQDEYAMDLIAQGYGHVASYHGVRNVLYMQPQQCTLPEHLHGSAWIADKSIEFIRNHTTNPKPFLLWTGFKDPHPPFNVPPAWAHKYDGKIPPHVSSITPLSAFAEENKALADLHDEATINRIRELYACSVSFMDHQVGRIVEALKESGQYENTLIIFTSDHGEMLADLDTYQKFLPHDASCKIPMILHWNQGIQAGIRRQEFVDLNDLLPTMVDVAQTTYPGAESLPGESLFAKTPLKDRTVQYVEHQREGKRWCSIRNKRYKYVYFYGEADQLFDLENDTYEQFNLLFDCVDEKTLAKKAQLKQILLQYEEKYGLEGYVVDGNFIPQPPREIKPEQECCFPHFTIRMPNGEVGLDSLEQEVLAAIVDEPLAKLSRPSVKKRLMEVAGFTQARYDAFMEMAKEANRY